MVFSAAVSIAANAKVFVASSCTNDFCCGDDSDSMTVMGSLFVLRNNVLFDSVAR